MEGLSAGSCRFPPGVIYSDTIIDAPRPLSKDEMKSSLALFDIVFCVEATFVMGDWGPRTGTKKKIARLGRDEYRLFVFWVGIGPPYEGFVQLCQAR